MAQGGGSAELDATEELNSTRRVRRTRRSPRPCRSWPRWGATSDELLIPMFVGKVRAEWSVPEVPGLLDLDYSRIPLIRVN
jgi:hypothetical protein